MPNTPLEQTESFRYFQELRGYLKTQLQLIEPNPVNPEKGPQKAVKVVISVENIAPFLDNGPDIVFMGVGLSLTYLGGDLHVVPKLTRQEKMDNITPQPEPVYTNIAGKSFPKITPEEQALGEVLFPGQTVSYEMSIPVNYIPYIQFRTEGNVSYRYLNHSQTVIPMPEEHTRPVALAALQAFNKIEINQMFESTINGLPVFNDITRFGEIKGFTEIVGKNMIGIKKMMDGLNAVHKDHKLFWAREHTSLAFTFLEHFRTKLESMKAALASTEKGKMAAESSAIKELGNEIIQLNRATELLIDKNHLSDEEVGYKYRIVG